MSARQLALVDEPHPLPGAPVTEVHTGPLVEDRPYLGRALFSPPFPEPSTDLIYCFALGLIVGLGIYQITRGGR